MSAVKDLVVKVISSKAASEIVKRYHYSGKVCNNSQVHFGVFKKGILVGALQFGSSIDKRRMAKSLGIGMNESLELNRMAISDVCGKNTESRVIGICLRLLKKQYPFLRCIVSFSDACQCGDGIIYRASNFSLHSYKKNQDIMKNSNGEIVFRHGGKFLKSDLRKNGYEVIKGYQMKYIYYFDKKLEQSHSSVPFDKIPDDVKMYKGIKRIEHESNAIGYQSKESGAIPTSTLQIKSGDL